MACRSRSFRCRPDSRFNSCTYRRYDTDVVPDARSARSRFGDRVRRPNAARPQECHERQFFGDSVKAAAEFSYVSLGIGMVLGVLIGLIPIPIPGGRRLSPWDRRRPAPRRADRRKAAPDRLASLGHAVAGEYRAP